MLSPPPGRRMSYQSRCRRHRGQSNRRAGRPLGHAQGREEIEKNAINQFMGVVPGIVGIQCKYPLRQAAPALNPEPPGIIFGFPFVLTAFAARAPVRLGTVRAGSGVTRTGVYLGSLLLSTPGGALRPGSQAGLRRLIVTRTESTLTALPKAAPHRWRSRSPGRAGI